MYGNIRHSDVETLASSKGITITNDFSTNLIVSELTFIVMRNNFIFFLSRFSFSGHILTASLT